MATPGISQPRSRPRRRHHRRALVARVEQALSELPLSKADIAAVAPQLAAGLIRFHCGSRNDSPFSDIRGKVTAVCEHFAKQGLTLQDYVRAARNQPQLFVKAPASLIANVEAVVRHFAEDGLTVRQYLEACLKQPQLFCLSPITIIRHLDYLIEMYRQGLLTFPSEAPPPPDEPLRPLFALLSRWPICLTFADDNYEMRIRYAQVTGDRPGGIELLHRPRRRIEEDLSRALGNPRPSQQ